MKIAIITDQHFGARKGSALFHDYFLKFYNDTFFPTLEREGITTVIDMGDNFDGRKGVDFSSLAWAKDNYYDRLQKMGCEIHTIVGAGGATGSLDASNMFKPALARGEIQCIGATTLNEYSQHIEKDGALERRFQKILVEETSKDETVEILRNIKDRYESHHNVNYTDEALIACVELSQRYITDRFLPDKAIDALDEAGSVSYTHLRAHETG